MTVPLVDLKAQYLSIKEAIDEAINHVITRANFIQGEEVALFEREFARYCGVKEAVAVSSGTEALRLALVACGIGQGDEVVTTPFTFIATAEAISQVGASPVFVDIDPITCNLDPKKVEWAVSKKTKAIIPVHLYGRPADMDGICAVARKYNLKVIEDAAQAHGARYKGKRVGTFGEVACFSFYPGKNLGAYGDAGMLVTNNAAIAERVRLLRDHGRKEKYEHLYVGFNSRMDTIQAAVLRVKLMYLDRWNARRRVLASVYRGLLRDLDLFVPPEDTHYESVYHLFVIRTPLRAHLRRVLRAAGVDTGIHYPIPLHLQPAYRHLGYQIGDFPESERAAREVLSLPLYPELPEDQVHRIAGIIARAGAPSSEVVLRD